jgi:putative ABC transport system substrate-binding protein
MPLVAFIQGGAADAMAGRVVLFRKGLSEAGFSEGQNVTVEYHWLEGHYDRLPVLLDDLVRRGVDVIATPGNVNASLAAKAATATIPIVFGVGEDPVALGLVKSLAHPGGNVTGVNFFGLETDAKRLGLMHNLLPKAHRFAVMLNPANASSAAAVSKDVKEAAKSVGLELVFLNASTPDEIDAAFTAIARERVDALFIAGDAFFSGRGVQFATLAVRDRLPASSNTRELAATGVLMSYGTDILDTYRQVGIYTGSILKGAKPAELPVLQSTKFQFVLNQQTAKSLGLEIPPMLLAQADEVIE